MIEQLVGAEQPSPRQVHPRRAVERDPLVRRRRRERGLAAGEERPLVCHHHVDIVPEHLFAPQWDRVDASR